MNDNTKFATIVAVIGVVLIAIGVALMASGGERFDTPRERPAGRSERQSSATSSSCANP
jgi:uncharacterized membrane protein YidH (DUF202 family)